MDQRIEIRKDNHGRDMKVLVRKALDVNSKNARYPGFKPEKLLLKKGSIRLKGYMALPCDIVLERDVAITLRDGVTIYADIFRPADDQKHPAIMAMSPYGKEIGSQWLDDTQITPASPWRRQAACRSSKARILPTGAAMGT
jgi:predicted acyl esterase